MLAKKTKASTCLFVKCNPGNNRISGLSSGRLLETSLRIRVCVDTHMYSRRGSTGRESYGVCANTHARLKNFAVVSPRWPVCFILIGNFSNNGVSAGNMKFHCCACLRFHSRVVSMHRSVELYSLKSLYAHIHQVAIVVVLDMPLLALCAPSSAFSPPPLSSISPPLRPSIFLNGAQYASVALRV